MVSVYIGAVGAEMENGLCSESIQNINMQEGDYRAPTIRATKGFEARQSHINLFLKSDKDAILLLDADMIFQPDTLDQLRSHGLPYISGYYMRRMHNPIIPVMFDYNEKNEWPYAPMTRNPQQLTRIGASGWGCVLVYREVFEAVSPLLKGESFVIEDDMDVWPYDLETMMRLIRILNTTNSMVTMKKASRALKNEFRLLRGMKDNVGSDIRFPFFAKQAGYELWLDPAVQPGHIIHYPLTANDFATSQEQGLQKDAMDAVEGKVADERKLMRDNLERLKNV